MNWVTSYFVKKKVDNLFSSPQQKMSFTETIQETSNSIKESIQDGFTETKNFLYNLTNTECVIRSCPTITEANSDYCAIHKCRIPDCPNKRMKITVGFCEEHQI